MGYAETLSEQIKQAFRLSLSNPYDILSENIENQGDFKSKVENFYRNFPDKPYMIFSKNPLDLPKKATKLKKKTDIDIVSTDNDYWEYLKIWETLVRIGDVGKNTELIKIADIFTSEINDKLREIKDKITKEKDKEKKLELIRELRNVGDFERAFDEIVKQRNELLKNIFSILREKDEIIDALNDGILKGKILISIQNLKNPKLKDDLLDEVSNFAYTTIEELRRMALKGESGKYLAYLKEKLKDDKRFENFIREVGINEKALLQKSSRHILFFAKLLELEDRLYKKLSESLNNELLNLGIEGNDNVENKIEVFKTIKSEIKDREKVKYIDNLIEIYTDIKNVRQQGKSIFLGEYKGNIYGLIEKYYNFSQSTQEKLFKNLVKLYNLDLTIWRMYKRNITPQKLENVLANSEFGLDLSDKTKKALIRFYSERIKRKDKSDIYLDPLSYSQIIKSIIYKDYALGQNLNLNLKGIKREIMEGRIFEGLKELNKLFLRQAGNTLVGLKGEELGECIEKALTGENINKEIESCFNKHFEAVDQKVKNLGRKIESKMGFSIQGVFFAPAYLGVLIFNDLQNSIMHLKKSELKRLKQKYKLLTDKLIYELDDEKRDREVRKFAFETIGFWSKITDSEFVEEEKSKIYAVLMGGKLKEILGEDSKWNNIIKELAKRINAYKNDDEINAEIVKELKTAMNKRDFALIGLITKTMAKEIEKTEFNDKSFKRNLLKTISKINDKNYPIEARFNQLAKLINTLSNQNLGKDRAILSSVLRKINIEFTEEKLMKNRKELQNKMLEKILQNVEGAKNPIEFLILLNGAKFKYGDKVQFELGELISREFKNNLLKYLEELKKKTLVIENDRSKKSLILVFNKLEEEDKNLLEISKSKFLSKFFGLTESKIKSSLEGDIEHGLEYKFLLDNFYKKRFKEKSLQAKPDKYIRKEFLSPF